MRTLLIGPGRERFDMASDPAPDRFHEPMVDEEPDLDEVLACVFDVRDHEVRIYRALLSHPDSTVEELADVLDRDRSNVNRSLATLMDKWGSRRAAGGSSRVAATSTSTSPPLARERAS